MMSSPTDPRRSHTKIAMLVAYASVLQILESILPNPFPGIRLGLANMITLVALVELGFQAALEIAVLRSLCSAFFLGTFFSPAFVISLSAAVVSSTAMGGALYLAQRQRWFFSGLIGISLIGAVAHNATQLGVVYVAFIRQPAVLWLWPWMGVSAVAMGWITGWVACKVCNRLDAAAESPWEWGPLPTRPETLGGASVSRNWLGKVPAEMKIILLVGLSVALVAYQSLVFYSVMVLVYAVLVWSGKVRLAALYLGVKRLRGFLILAVLVPVFFQHGGVALWELGPLHISTLGMLTGAQYALRLILFMTGAVVLAQTTSSQALTQGFNRVLSPLRWVGISPVGMTDMMTQAGAWIPVLLDQTKGLIRQHRLHHPASFKRLVSGVAALVVGLFMQAEKLNSEGEGWTPRG